MNLARFRLDSLDNDRLTAKTIMQKQDFDPILPGGEAFGSFKPDANQLYLRTVVRLMGDKDFFRFDISNGLQTVTETENKREDIVCSSSDPADQTGMRNSANLWEIIGNHIYVAAVNSGHICSGEKTTSELDLSYQEITSGSSVTFERLEVRTIIDVFDHAYVLVDLNPGGDSDIAVAVIKSDGTLEQFTRIPEITIDLDPDRFVFDEQTEAFYALNVKANSDDAGQRIGYIVKLTPVFPPSRMLPKLLMARAISITAKLSPARVIT